MHLINIRSYIFDELIRILIELYLRKRLNKIIHKSLQQIAIHIAEMAGIPHIRLH